MIGIVYVIFQQDIGEAMKAFIDQVSNPPTKLMILGPTFSSQAMVVADTAAHYNLVQVRLMTYRPCIWLCTTLQPLQPGPGVINDTQTMDVRGTAATTA